MAYFLDFILVQGFSAIPFSFLGLIFMASSITIGLALFSEKKYIISFTAIVGGMFIYHFGITPLNLLGILLLGLFMFSAQMSSTDELKDRIKISPHEVVRKGIPAVLMGIYLMISFAAFQSPLADWMENMNRLPSQSETLIKKVVASVLGNQLGMGSQNDVIVSGIAKEANEQANLALSPYFKYAPPAFAFASFLILISLSWIFVWTGTLIGIALFFILKKAKFYDIQEKEIMSEVLVI
jgi:hypothetical protein